MASPEEIKQAALAGKLEQEYPLTSKLVRIFTSSTFTDTKVERNALMAKVYPGLKTFCQERGYEFQVVDMRWGVRDEATDDHMTSELCMKEIQECQRLSTGPNFVTFLAQKYGYRPFPPKIAAEEFEAILSQVTDDQDKELLTSWFIKDDNTMPPKYLLQSIRTKLPHYADDTDPDKKKQDRNAWWAAFERMQVVLREASEKAFPEQEEVTLKYKWAVTEEEIHYGILRASNPNESCYWFKRTISDIGKFIKEKMTARFMDAIKGAPDKDALGLLDRLKNEHVAKVLPKDCVTQYTVKWTENGIDPNISEEHKTYIEKFCKDFDNTLRAMISKGIDQRVENEIKDSLVIECMNHIGFAKSKLDVFSGREDFLDTIKKRLTSANGEEKGLYLVLCGEPGAGKTSLMAKLSQQMPIWMETTDAPVLLRFLGTTSASASTRDMLGSLCSQLNELTQAEEDLPTDFKSLAEQFKRYLAEYPEPLVVILDSLDQLRDKGGKLREWLPTEVPKRITFVLSAIPSEEFFVVPEMKKFLPESYFMDVPTFSSNDISSVLKCWLQTAGRTLTGDQRKLVEETCQGCPLPLFAKLTVDEALRWKSYTPVDDIVLGKTVIESINFLFERVEKYHGLKLVGRALGFVTAAKSGLSLNEIEDVLSLDDFALNDVYQYHQPPLRRLPPLLWVRIQSDLRDYLISSGADGITVIRWYHRQFQTVATERYLGDQEIKKEIHCLLVEYFLGKWSGDVKKDFVDKKGNPGAACRFVAAQPYVFNEKSETSATKFNLRALNELPYHLTMIGDPTQLLENVLVNFEFMYYKLKAASFDSLLDDYEFSIESGITHPDISTMIEFLRLSKDVLVIEAEQLPTQITGRLTAMNTGSPGLIKLIDDASKPFFNCLISTQPHLRGGGGSFTGKLVGSEGRIQCLNFNKDYSICISCAEDAILRLWSMSTGDIIKNIDMSTVETYFVASYCQDIGFCNDDKWAYIISSRNIFVWDLEIEQNLQRLEMATGVLHGTKPYLLPDTVTLVIVGEENLEVWNLKSGKKEESREVTPPRSDLPTGVATSAVDQLKGCGETVIFHRKSTYGIDIFDMSKSAAPKKEHMIINEKRKNLTSIVIATCPAGNLAYMFWEEPADVGKPMTATFGVLDLSDFKTIFLKENIEYGHFIGYFMFCPYREKDFIVTTHPAGKMVINLWKDGSDDFQELETLNTTYITHYKETRTGLAVTVTMTDPSLMEIMDFNNMAKSAEGSGGDEEELNPGSVQVFQPLGGSKRYYYFNTAEYQLGIWDAAERKTIRWIIPPVYYPFGCCVTPTTLAYANHETKMICTMDTIDGTIKETGAKGSDIPGGHCRVSYVGNNSVLYTGPKPNQITVSKLPTGKEVWSLSVEKDGKLSGLILSEDGRVAIADIPQTVDEMTSERTEQKTLDAKLYCFDIKQRKRLPDLKCKNTTHLSTTMTLQCNALLTPDGKYYICSSIVDGDETNAMVWETATGKRRKLPQDSPGTVPGNVIYSKAGKCLVCSYQFPGQIVFWDLAKLEKIKTIPAAGVYFLWPSQDGTLTAYIDMNKKTVMQVLNIKTGKVVRRFCAETEVAHCSFTEDNEFLMVSCRNKKSIVQLHLYDADKQSKMAGKDTPFPRMEQLKLEEIKKERAMFDAPKKMNLQKTPGQDENQTEDKKEKSTVKKPSSGTKAKAVNGKAVTANGSAGTAGTPKKGKTAAKTADKKATAARTKAK